MTCGSARARARSTGRSDQRRFEAMESGARIQSVRAMRPRRSALCAGVGAPGQNSPCGWRSTSRLEHREELDRAEAAFRRALELNADLPIAHNLYAQFEVDRGRAHDAMMRLVSRARSAEPELFAGLVDHLPLCEGVPCRIDAQARRLLESGIRTSVEHTSFLLQRDHERVARNTLTRTPTSSRSPLGALGHTGGGHLRPSGAGEDHLDADAPFHGGRANAAGRRRRPQHRCGESDRGLRLPQSRRSVLSRETSLTSAAGETRTRAF